jgi:hypothetical protein
MKILIQVALPVKRGEGHSSRATIVILCCFLRLSEVELSHYYWQELHINRIAHSAQLLSHEPLSVQKAVTKLGLELGLFKIKDKAGFKRWVIREPAIPKV